ncbi:toll/interleukin-1 receptor domain-containing protein [Bernardetia sp. ABR2-2B]|uniref:toll/interleukin-1 receptor domain-containing protein n=1 Tax=Bernardetia sp. ABR2-2B TaxID=3127472 RepID=UPI0030D0912B
MMTEEEVIKLEAKDFFEESIEASLGYNVDNKVSELRSKLYGFYSDVSKAIFLDEIYKHTHKYVKNHIDKAHNGEASSECQVDVGGNKLLYYIKQEVSVLPKIAHQKFESDGKERNKVFVSYSHLDTDFLLDIKRHFKPFSKKIDFWDDTKIEPGQKWKDEIKKAIEQTKVAILLVSTDFLGSEFIADEELPPLLKAAEEHGAVVLTVILKPCLFDEFTDISQYQTMNPPTKPVSRMDENEKEDLYVNLVRQTKKFLDKA